MPYPRQSDNISQPVVIEASIYIYIYILTNPSTWSGCDTRSIFKRSLTNDGIQNFFPPRPDIIPRLKSSVCPTTHPELEGKYSDTYLSLVYKRNVKSKCNGYHRRKWTRRPEFKSWTKLIAFHIALMPLGKVWIQLFSLQLWVNSRTD